MIALVVFALFVASASAADQVVAVSQDTLGNYNLKYSIDGISRVEQGDHFGNVNGGFSYIDPHGFVSKTEFTSGVHGYNAIGTDIPVPVQDTPEVAHAKINHLSVLNSEYLRPKLPQFQGPEKSFYVSPIAVGAAPIAPIARFAAPIAHLAPEPIAPVHFAASHFPALPAHIGHVGIPETPEVLAARAQHFAAHAAARNAHYLH